MCRLEKEAEWKWKWESLLSGTEWVTSRQALYTSTVQTSDQTGLSRGWIHGMQDHVVFMMGHVVNGTHDWLVTQVIAIGTRSHDLMVFMTCCCPLNSWRAWTSATSSVHHPFVAVQECT